MCSGKKLRLHPMKNLERFLSNGISWECIPAIESFRREPSRYSISQVCIAFKIIVTTSGEERTCSYCFMFSSCPLKQIFIEHFGKTRSWLTLV